MTTWASLVAIIDIEWNRDDDGKNKKAVAIIVGGTYRDAAVGDTTACFGREDRHCVSIIANHQSPQGVGYFPFNDNKNNNKTLSFSTTTTEY